MCMEIQYTSQERTERGERKPAPPHPAQTDQHTHIDTKRAGHWIPSLEMGWWVKDLLRHANSPHTSIMYGTELFT